MSERETTIIPFLAGRGLCLDVGAAQGIYSVEMLKCGRPTLAFEPLFDIYAESLAPLVRQYPKLSVLPYAASHRPGRAVIRVPQFAGKWQPQRASISQDFSGVPHEDFDVPLVTIDSLGLEDVSFIKIDVEGNEINVVLGALETIRRCRPTLLVEMEQRHIPGNLITAIEVIEALGYCSYILLDHGLVRRDTLDLREIQAEGLRRVDPSIYLNNIIFLPTKDRPANRGWIAPFVGGGEPAVRLWADSLAQPVMTFGLGEDRADLPSVEADGRFQRVWQRADPLAPTQVLKYARTLNLDRAVVYYEPGILGPHQGETLLRGLVEQGIAVSLLIGALSEVVPLPSAAAQCARRVFTTAEVAGRARELGVGDGVVLPEDGARAVDLLFGN